MWAIVPFDVGRDYAMWASITLKQKMRPTSQRSRGPHHTGISGPLPMESLAHLDRNTQIGGNTMNDNDVTSDFAEFCGVRDLDPVEVLRVLNAQDWHPADEEPEYTMQPVTIHEDFV